MRKPLILLVDDERAVLEALEAMLVPAFEEICRIEVFDDPREVLAMMPRWAAERRTIAVAVVDQKMPHLAGVELLGRLKGNAGGTPEAGQSGRGRSGARRRRLVPRACRGYGTGRRSGGQFANRGSGG